MPTGWRLVPTHRKVAAFTGEGARIHGARWNSPGVALVYLSEHLSLAALEVLVHRHLHRWRWDFLAYRAEWDEELTRRLERAALPAAWRAEPTAEGLRELGDAWVRGKRSAVLGVPSVLIPEELNYLLNPAHPDFRRIQVGPPTPFALDPRLRA